MASKSKVNRAPRAASDRPLVRYRRRSEPQAPREALSKISKSIASRDFPENQAHFSWPMASEIGRIRAAEAILDSILTIVRPEGHLSRGRSLSTARLAIIAPI